jgi:hypothetical protein
MDLGAIYTGAVRFVGYDYSQVVLGTGEVVTVPIYASDLSALSKLNVDQSIIDAAQKYYGKVEKCPVTPVLKFNLVFRIF